MTPETAFRSDERFTQSDFRRWLEERPSTDINHYELIDGRIVMTPLAGWPHGTASVLYLQKSKYGPARTIQSGVVKSRILPGLEVPVEEIFGA
jgi:hypothetical protein